MATRRGWTCCARRVVARARDVTHWHELRDRGITLVQHELFESSLLSSQSVLTLLGRSPEQVAQERASSQTLLVKISDESLQSPRQN